jgi:hypothetical protein
MTKDDFALSIIASVIASFLFMVLLWIFRKQLKPFFTKLFRKFSRKLFPNPLPIEYPNPRYLSKVREKEIRRLVRQIMTGQSSAIVGPFGTERTSILEFLRDKNPEQRAKLYGEKANRLIFSYLDISSLRRDCSQAQFWKQVLKPLPEKFKESDSVLSKAYQDCQDNKFDNFSLDKLLTKMKQADWRLVLMLDRFDELLHRFLLKRPEFLGGLRALASSRHPSPLALILTGNISLNQSHQNTKDINPMGSPYFNFIESGEITLGALSEAEIDQLLQQTERHLSEQDSRFLKERADGHPYLLQIATTALWEAYDTGEKAPLKSADDRFYETVKVILNNVLQTWPPNRCQAFLSVARKREVSGFRTELEELEKQGFVIQDNGEWRIRSRVFSKWLAEKTEQELCQK